MQLGTNRSWESFQQFGKSQHLDDFLSHDSYRIFPEAGHDRDTWCHFNETAPRYQCNYDHLRELGVIEAEDQERAAGIRTVYSTMYLHPVAISSLCDDKEAVHDSTLRAHREGVLNDVSIKGLPGRRRRLSGSKIIFSIWLICGRVLAAKMGRRSWRPIEE